MKTRRERALLAAIAACCMAATLPLFATGAQAAGDTGASPLSATCPKGKLAVAQGCVRPAVARKKVVGLARQALREHGLRAVLLRVDVGRRNLAAVSLGNSMAGVPATRRMRFRIGAMAIPYLAVLLLQLQDEGRLSLDDQLTRWLPSYPNADRVSLRMLLNNTSGYPDWIQGNQAFVDDLYANVFRQWTPDELIGRAFARPLACEPGACFTYAHTNYALISKVLRAVTGKPVARLMRNRVFRPLGLRETRVSALPGIPSPVLHAYSSARGPYEDSTFWSPSWTIGSGTIMTSTVGEMARSARAIGSGRLISRRGRRQMFGPSTVGLPGMSPDLYYGLGVLVAGNWRLQSPMLNGYTGVMAYLPSKRISLALAVTTGERAAREDRNYSGLVFERISGYLAPGNPVQLPG